MLRCIEGDCETAYFSLVSIFTYRLIIVPFWFCKFGLVNSVAAAIADVFRKKSNKC